MISCFFFLCPSLMYVFTLKYRQLDEFYYFRIFCFAIFPITRAPKNEFVKGRQAERWNLARLGRVHKSVYIAMFRPPIWHQFWEDLYEAGVLILKKTKQKKYLFIAPWLLSRYDDHGPAGRRHRLMRSNPFYSAPSSDFSIPSFSFWAIDLDHPEKKNPFLFAFSYFIPSKKNNKMALKIGNNNLLSWLCRLCQ